MSKPKILVTGGAGFIGSHTVVELIAAGYEPIIVDNFSNSQKGVIERLEELTGQSLKFYEQDFQDATALTKIITDEGVTGIIHFAAYKAVNESVEEPLKYYQNNVAGLITLLKVVEQQKVPHFVFSSSCTVYGEPETLPVTENEPLKPAVSPYGATKQMCEEILRDTTVVSSRLRSIALRYFNPIGAHPSGKIGELPLGTPACLVPYLTQAVAKLRPPLTVYGNDYPTPDGTCIRDYIHVVDLARAHVSALRLLESQKAASYEVCNVGTGTGSSVSEVITTFEKVTGESVPYTFGARRAGDIVSSYADVTKAKELLGWQSEFTLADALKDAWRWQQTL